MSLVDLQQDGVDITRKIALKDIKGEYNLPEFMKMEFIKAVKGLITRLGSNKRCNSDERALCNEEPPHKKAKRYDLTPLAKFTPRIVEARRSMCFEYILNEFVLTTETRNFEFKKGGVCFDRLTLRKMVGKYGTAFLNSEGGVVLFGVLDDGNVIGVFLKQQDHTRIAETIICEFKKFRPVVSNDLYDIKFMPVYRKFTSERIPNLYVVEMRVRKGATMEIYETEDHRVFIRRDGGVQGPLRPLAIKDLAISKYKQNMQEQKNKSK